MATFLSYILSLNPALFYNVCYVCGFGDTPFILFVKKLATNFGTCIDSTFFYTFIYSYFEDRIANSFLLEIDKSYLSFHQPYLYSFSTVDLTSLDLIFCNCSITDSSVLKLFFYPNIIIFDRTVTGRFC